MYGEYTGPYWSNGKFQSSVKFGNKKPKNRLDAESRLHDTAYAICDGEASCLDAADDIYYRQSKNISGPAALLAGNIVKYGNSLTRHGKLWGVEVDQGKVEELERLYSNDPIPENQLGRRKEKGIMSTADTIAKYTLPSDVYVALRGSGTKTQASDPSGVLGDNSIRSVAVQPSQVYGPVIDKVEPSVVYAPDMTPQKKSSVVPSLDLSGVGGQSGYKLNNGQSVPSNSNTGKQIYQDQRLSEEKAAGDFGEQSGGFYNPYLPDYPRRYPKRKKKGKKNKIYVF